MKQTPILIFLTAITIGLFLLFNNCSTEQTLQPDKEIFTHTEKQVSSLTKHYQQGIALLQKRGDSLQQDLNQTQLKLKVAKLKLQQSKFDVVTLAKKDTTGESVVQQLNDCDSLKEQVLLFTTCVDSTQSDYEMNITQLNNLLAIKDSQMVICAASYSQLKDMTDENLQREQKLTEDLNTAYKQQRNNRVQNKVLAAGFLILSGITTTLFINSRK